MTVEIGPHSSRRVAMSWSISLGAIPAQATRMAADAKSELARAISQQVSNILCGRYTTPADVVSSSADLMGLGLALCESTRLAHGRLVVALIDGIMHFQFHGDSNPSDGHDGDDPDTSGPDNRPRSRELHSHEFVRLVSSALMELAFSESDHDEITRNRMALAAAELLAINPLGSEGDIEDVRSADNPAMPGIFISGYRTEEFANPIDLRELHLSEINQNIQLIGDMLSELSQQSRCLARKTLSPSDILMVLGQQPDLSRPIIIDLRRAQDLSAPREMQLTPQVTSLDNLHDDGLWPSSPIGEDAPIEMLPFLISDAGSRSRVGNWLRPSS